MRVPLRRVRVEQRTTGRSDCGMEGVSRGFRGRSGLPLRERSLSEMIGVSRWGAIVGE